MHPTPPDFTLRLASGTLQLVISDQPLLTVVQFEGAMIAALAALFAAIWMRSREAGANVLAWGFAVTALWYLTSDAMGVSGPTIDSARMRLWGGLILVGVMLVNLGVVLYLGAPHGRWRVLLSLLWVPPLLLLFAIAVTPDVPRRLFHVGGLMPYVGATLLAFRRARQHPGDGHVLLGCALLMLALTPFVLLAFGLPAVQLKYFAGAAVVLFGMALLTISFLRRQRALETEVSLRSKAQRELREANVRLEERVLERTAHLNELIGGLEEFNRSVSHDLRGPLGGMATLARMAADALARGDLAMAQRALPVIATQCDDSVNLVVTMLDLARLSDPVLRPEPIRLDGLIQAAFDEVTLGMPDKGRPGFRCGPMPTVMADPRLLRPVLVNLIGNAVKFSREAARPLIEVDATVRDRDLVVCVRDNGVGLSAEVAERIFDPFFRAHGARFDGHGLGLSIVRRAVQAMKGRAWAEPRPQGGAALCFTLPGAVVAEAGRPSEPALTA
jgi:signal transduction histidine kinase